MPIIENQLNGRLATLLGRANPRWTVRGENIGAFLGSQRQPDILVVQSGNRPVVIENEYVPARSVESEAVARLGESLDAGVVAASGQVNAVIALKSPTELRDCIGLDDVDALLHSGVTLEYALYTGHDPQNWIRFPESGFIPGTLPDLAGFVEHAATPFDAIERATVALEQGVLAASAMLCEAAGLVGSTGDTVAEELKQDFDEQTAKMAATIIVNALMFQENLSGYYDVRSVSQMMRVNELTPLQVTAEWMKILEVNYWSIFHIATDLLVSINPSIYGARMLNILGDTADGLREVAQSHDLVGTVFQRLIADRKFLATFYTRPESATLLAHLSIPDNEQWAAAERLKQFRIADYACGTGTLIHAAYRRVNQLHRLAGGDPEASHGHMMEQSLTACDVLPSAVHLTASMLSSSYPQQHYAKTNTHIMEYGRKADGNGVAIGSLDLLDGEERRPMLFATASPTTITGDGDQTADYIYTPSASQSLVIMNPPFTRGSSDWAAIGPQAYNKKQFRGLGNDRETQKKMSDLAKRFARGTCAHGYAGIASWFVALGDRMVSDDGTLALVLPMTALQSTSWQKTRSLIKQNYGDVIVLTIAAASADDQSFSADTGMAETLLVCRKSPQARRNRGLFVSLYRRPRNEMEAAEIARAIRPLVASHNLRTLEDGPAGAEPLRVGEEHVGEVVDTELLDGPPWSAIGLIDFSVAQTAWQLAHGIVWLPQMSEMEAPTIPVSTVDRICQIGINDVNIVGRGQQTAFELVRPMSAAATYPMLWGHDAGRETHLIVEPDSDGRIKTDRAGRAAEIWATRSHAHHNRGFRFNSQPLAVAFTERQTIGGRAWPNVRFEKREQEIAYTLWGNTTPGLLLYWWHSSRQQSGRGSMPISAIRTMPTLDVTRLSPEQLTLAEAIFEDMRDLTFLPANEAYRDNTRQELDHRVLIDLLGLPESILEPLDLLRLKWCSEPSVHGGKSTRP